MPGFSRFLRLYWTDLIPDTVGTVIADPVRVEIFRGPRTYSTFAKSSPSVVRAGVERTIAIPHAITVPSDRVYIELIARTREDSGHREESENHINRVVTQMAALLSPQLFYDEVWSGWLSDSSQLRGDMWIMQGDPVPFSASQLEKRLGAFRRALRTKGEADRRFTLMSRLFSRAVTLPPGDERFLALWTALEVFPMEDTSDIRPISTHLAQIVGLPASDIKKRLGIGRLFGARSTLVHDGVLPYDTTGLADAVKRLELIALVVVRALGGVPYAGELDEFLS